MDKKYLLRKFPDVELSYDRLLHKKVWTDAYVLIPTGKTCFIWFTYYNGKNIAVKLVLDSNGRITSVEPIIMCFSNVLAYGTILYGTSFKYEDRLMFSVEDLHYYKGRNVEHIPFIERLRIYTDLFKEIKDLDYTDIRIGMPQIETSYIEAQNAINKLPYTIDSILCYNNNDCGSVGYYINRRDPIRRAKFKIRATIEADIYNLYCNNNEKEEFYDIAMIPSYKKSVELNSYFRNIKENENLDLLEESEDEDEFENTSYSKYVNLSKMLTMDCVYMPRFKKWMPLKVIETNNITSKKELHYWTHSSK